MADLASQPAAVGQAFNIGTTEEVSILELAERIIQLTNSRSKIVMVPYDEAYGPGFEDMQRRVPSLDKIAAVIGFRPLSTLEDSLRRVIDYERNSGAIRLPET
jgi:UDP-glucose 4-epimerase